MRRKRKEADENKAADVGLVMTVSLFLILLTFFILLNSIAVLDERKVLDAIGSLTGAFGSLPGGLSPMKSGDSIMPPTSPMMQREMDVGELLSIMDKHMAAKIKVVKERDAMTISINEETLFYEESLKLKPSSWPLLKKLGEFIRPWDYSVDFMGYTDNLPAEERGYRSNWEISVLMAVKVLRYFAEKEDILPERLTAYGFGSTRPIASNETNETRMKNRRVDIVLYTNPPLYIKRIYRRQPIGIFSYKKFNFNIF
jgi:chemotaxis protein MotB